MPDAQAPAQPYPHGALPIGTRLGEFEIRRVLGVGGFGIVYLAFDHLLEREVALKEYMPSALVDRAETMHVSLLSEANADTFALGLRSFVNEARLLARFDHPSLVKVYRFWEANGTAYMAMALYKGRTVRDVRLEMKSRPDEAWVRSILEPLLGAIEKLHGEDVYHRDIAPDNILIEADGRPVLLDFGAARRVISDRSQALTAILKPSYAPIEQYADVGGMKQGPWTDIYALGATMHFLLLGKPPPPAPGRSIQDMMPPLAGQDLPGVSREFLELIDWMLTPLPTERPQNVAAVRDALAGRIKPPRKLEVDMRLPAGGDGDERTVVVPRGQTSMPTSQGEDATVLMPRPGQTSFPSTTRQPPPARPPVPDEDATVVTPLAGGYPTQRQAPPPAPQAPPPPPRQVAMPPMATVAPPRQPAPQATRSQQPTMAPPAPAPQPPAAKGWAVPVLAGVVVAAVVGGGLWWFLTRPVAKVVATPAPASAPAPAPAVPAPTATAPTSPTPPAEAPGAAPVVPVAASQPPAGAAPVPPVVAQPSPATPAPPRPQATPTAPGPSVRPPPSGTAKAPAKAPEAQAVRPAEPTPVAPVPPPPGPSPTAQPAPPVAPAPAPASAVAEDNRPKSPSERCAKELPLVRLICIDLACNRAEFVRHPECVKLRAEQQANKRLTEGN